MDTIRTLFGGDKGVTTRELRNQLPAIRSLAQPPPHNKYSSTVSVLIMKSSPKALLITRVGTLIVATIYLQLLQNRYMFRSFTVLQCSHQHCVRPVASDVEVVGYL